MPSPFPGMDPYLESEDIWHDFHVRYVPALAAALTPLLPPQYIAKTDQDVFIRELSVNERQRVGRPDVFVVPGGQPIGRASASASMVAAGPSIAAAFPVTPVDVERLALSR